MTTNDLTIELLGGQNISLIPGKCHQCTYWEDPDFWTSDKPAAIVETRKRAWFRDTAGAFGPCGMAVKSGDEVIAFAEFALPENFPTIADYAIPADPDVPFIACLCVKPDWQRRGVGSEVVRAIEREMASRGFHRLQTYARKSTSNNPVGPLEFWLANGYEVASDGKDFALMTRDI